MSIIIGSWVASIITDLLIAVCLTCLGRTMSWYARPLWIFFLYVIPTLLVSMAVILLHAKYYQKVLSFDPSRDNLNRSYKIPGSRFITVDRFSTILRRISTNLDYHFTLRRDGEGAFQFHRSDLGVLRIAGKLPKNEIIRKVER
jgi:hypothetical protein